MRCLWLVNPAQWQGSKPTCDGVWAEAYDSHPSPSLVSFSSFTSALTENVSGPAVLRAHTSQWPFLRVYHHGCLRISGRDDLTTVSQSAPLSSKSRRRQTELWQSWKEENQMKHLLFPGSHWHSSGPATQSPESSVSINAQLHLFKSVPWKLPEKQRTGVQGSTHSTTALTAANIPSILLYPSALLLF